MKTKTVYVTDDGNEWENAEQAEAHERRVSMVNDMCADERMARHVAISIAAHAPQVLDVLLKHLHPDLHRVGLDRLIAAAERMDREVKPDTAVLASVGFTECPHCKAPTKPYVDVTGRERCAVCVKPLEPVT